MNPRQWFSERTLVRRAPLLALLTFVLIAIAALVETGKSVHRNALRGLDAHLADVLRSRRTALVGAISTLRSDVRFLSETPPIAGIIRAIAAQGFDAQDRTDLAQWKRRLESIFSAYLRTHVELTQVRYIGIADGGLEIVRVDRVGGAVQVVPAPNSDRPMPLRGLWAPTAVAPPTRRN